MDDKRKTKAQLIAELQAVRAHTAKPECGETDGQGAAGILRENEETYRAFVDESLQGFVIVSEDSRLLYANQAAAEMCGYTVDELLELPPGKAWELVHPDDRVSMRESINAVRAGESVAQSYELRITARDGAQRWAEVHPTVVRIGGRPAVQAILLNVTERKTAEQALRESESKLSSILSSMVDLVFVFDEDKRFVFYRSPPGGRLYAPPEEFLGKRPCDVMPAYFHELFDRAFQDNRKGEVSEFEYSLEMGGEIGWSSAKLSPLLVDGEFRGSVAVVRDITEGKKAGEALRASEERYRAIFEQAADSIVIFDTEGGPLMEFNDRAHQSLGYTREEFGKLKIPDFEVIESPEDVAEHIRNVVREGPDVFETKHRTKSGEIRDILVSARRISSGGQDLIQGIWRDITERKRAEEALRESEERYRTFMQNFHGIAFRGHVGFRPIFFHGAVEEITGYTEDDFLASQPRWDQIIYPDDWQRISESVERIGSIPGYSSEREHRIIRKDGQIRWVREFIQNMCDSSGKVTMVQGAIYDITEHKRAEQQRRELEAQLQQSQKMEAIGHLAGGVAEEFNNLLTGILGYVDVLKLEAEAGSRAHNAGGVIEQAAERGAELTQQLLGFARTGKRLNAPVDMHVVVHGVLGLLRRTIEKSIRIVPRLHARDTVIMGDSSQMEQVVLNLAVNARAAMPEGGEMTFETVNVELDHAHCRHCPEAAPGRYLMLAVTDTGCGIPGDLQDRVFEPFFRVNAQEGAAGMGLAVVYGIVRSHGGVIHVYSEVGHGAIFKVYLPVAKDARSRPDEFGAQVVARGNGRILMVEEEEGVRHAASDMLHTLGYEVVKAASAKEAVDYYGQHAHEVDLAIIDMMMAGTGGRACFDALKAINPDVKAVLSTGDSFDTRVEQTEGIVGLMQKPYRMGRLSSIVRDALSSE